METMNKKPWFASLTTGFFICSRLQACLSLSQIKNPARCHARLFILSGFLNEVRTYYEQELSKSADEPLSR
jgi:hypothetical protein